MNVLKSCLNSLSPAPTYFAIVLHKKCSDEAAQVIHDVLVEDWEKGGGGLQVRRQLPTRGFPETILHITATNQHILRIADFMEMKKMDKEGHIRPFCLDDLEDFEETGRVGPLELSDVHRCVSLAIDRVHFDTSISQLPGHPSKSVMKGAPVISTYQEVDLISVFPIHDPEDLDRLYKSWTLFDPPLDLVRNYFGESVALYWSFAESYTKFLFLIAFLGFLEFVFEFFGVNYIYSNLLFSFFNLLCLSIFLELWKRKNAEHSFFWGTAGKLRHKSPRPEFRGELARNPVSGKEEMYYPSSRRVKKILTVSLPITLVCFSVAFLLMTISFEADIMMAEFLKDEETEEIRTDLLAKVFINLPSIIYSVSILVFNKIYLKLARWLTTWENHRTQEQHDVHITLKLIPFEFVNTFLALFYLGFYLKDLSALRAQLFTTLLVQQIVNQIQEVVIPLVLHRPASVKLLHKVSKKLGIDEKPSFRGMSGVSNVEEDDPNVKEVNHDMLAEPLDSLHDDFMELWLQFGHVFLFSAVYPLAACFALLNNLTELFADRYKLCKLSRKPRPLAVRDIGAWYLAFRITAILSICSNCALLALDLRDTAGAGWSDTQWFGLLVTMEHIFIIVFLGTNRLISDTPAHVKLAMDKTDFHFRQKHVKHQES